MWSQVNESLDASFDASGFRELLSCAPPRQLSGSVTAQRDEQLLSYQSIHPGGLR